jgi:hypothetical protein
MVIEEAREPGKYNPPRLHSGCKLIFSVNIILLFAYILGDSLVDIAAGYGRPGFYSQRGHDFSLLHSFKTGSGAHPASHKILPGALYPEAKRLGRDADHSLPSNAEVTNGGAIPPLPIRLHGVLLN